MQRNSNEIEDVEITICDEDCLPYRDPDDDKEDEEWDMDFGRYSRPVRYRRKLIYTASAVGTFAFTFGLMYWSYYVMYYCMDIDE
jgi:hypothetical protein